MFFTLKFAFEILNEICVGLFILKYMFSINILFNIIKQIIFSVKYFIFGGVLSKIFLTE